MALSNEIIKFNLVIKWMKGKLSEVNYIHSLASAWRQASMFEIISELGVGAKLPRKILFIELMRSR